MKEAEAGERLLAYADPSPSVYTNRELIASDNPAAAIISHHFCSSHSMDLAIVRKVLTIREGNFVVIDITGNMIFKVRGSLFFSLHDRRVLLDTAGHPIITLRKKVWPSIKGNLLYHTCHRFANQIHIPTIFASRFK